MQQRLIQIAHEGHQGINKCKSQLRELYWWPKMASEIEEFIRACPCCKSIPRESPVQAFPYPCRPWNQLGIDIKGPILDEKLRKMYIVVVVDYYTKIVQVKTMSNVSSKDIISFIDTLFSLLGLPNTLVSDNGPQFISSEFEQYLKSKGIVHRRSAVYNPQANGCVERVNRNINKVVENCQRVQNYQELQNVLNDYLLNYNNTHHDTTGRVPTSLLLRHEQRTKLGMIINQSDMVESNEAIEIEKRIREKQQVRQTYANRRRRPASKNLFKVGDAVITIGGGVKILKNQLGPWTFQTEDGMSVNTRKLKKKPPESQEVKISENDERPRRERKVPASLQEFIY
jgi:hypothetical protein